MKIGHDITKRLAKAASVMSTIGGGMTMPNGDLQLKKDHYLYNLKVPGVEPNNFNIEINNQNLLVFHHLRLDREEDITHLVRRIIIPAEVNYQNITAEFHDGYLSIKLPFNELAGGFHKDIDLDIS